jgi:hypothetical protein
MEDKKNNFSNMMIAIMSYNRGKYLKNCIHSIEKNFSLKNIKIYDDDSSCHYTRKYLKIISKKYPVYVNKKKTDNNLRGLYLNMNKALNHALQDGFDFIFIIQDDIQIVRSCDKDFFSECSKIFNSDNKIIQIVPVFFKGDYKNINFNKKSIVINKEPDYYWRKNKWSGISDVGIIKIEELKKNNWQWNPEENEECNMKVAAKNNWKYVFSRNPIMMYTPWPETYRANKKNIQYIMEKFLMIGLNPYKNMTEEKVDLLLNRPLDSFPIAESYLKAKNNLLSKPWEYSTPSLLKMIILSLKIPFIFIKNRLIKKKYEK